MKTIENSKTEKEVQNQAMQWFTRSQSGMMTEKEQSEFTDWYSSDMNHASCYDEIKLFWESPEFNIASNIVDEKHNVQSSSKHSHSLHKPLWAMAATLLLSVVIFLNLNVFKNVDYVTASGKQKHIRLDDGSQLILNTDSAVDVMFDNHTRLVNLKSGEIYFDVTKDPDNRPFKVYANDVLVKVLGTRFSVNTTNNVIEVNGHSGRIEVATDDSVPQVITRGDRIIVDDSGLHKSKFDPAYEFAWIHNRLAFHDQPLSEVINELDRYLVGRIVVIDKKVATTRITGSYSLNNPEQIIQSISNIVSANNSQMTPWLYFIH